MNDVQELCIAVAMPDLVGCGNKTEQPIFDGSVLVKWFGSDKLKIHDFTQDFLKSIRSDMVKVDVALGGSDFAELAELGHRIGGAAGLVGAMKLAKLCKILEKDCRDGVVREQLHDVVSQIHHMIDRINEQVCQVS